MREYNVTLYLVYRVTARNKEEAQSAAWRAHGEEITPEHVGAGVDRVFSPKAERGVRA